MGVRKARLWLGLAMVALLAAGVAAGQTTPASKPTSSSTTDIAGPLPEPRESPSQTTSKTKKKSKAETGTRVSQTPDGPGDSPASGSGAKTTRDAADAAESDASAGQKASGEGSDAASQNQQRSAEAAQAAAGESSSRDTLIDLSPPPGQGVRDLSGNLNFPGDSDTASGGDDVAEFHPYDPHKALKNVEVGDYHFKRKNYVAAISRYREALLYKPDDALATYRLAVALERTGQASEAQKNYEGYLKILPHGELAAEAQKALERLAAGKKGK